MVTDSTVLRGPTLTPRINVPFCCEARHCPGRKFPSPQPLRPCNPAYSFQDTPSLLLLLQKSCDQTNSNRELGLDSMPASAVVPASTNHACAYFWV